MNELNDIKNKIQSLENELMLNNSNTNNSKRP